jgi:hypothetical protein
MQVAVIARRERLFSDVCTFLEGIKNEFIRNEFIKHE